MCIPEANLLVDLGFYVPLNRSYGDGTSVYKSHPKDWRSPGSNSRPLVYKASSLTTRPRRLLRSKSGPGYKFAYPV